MQKFFILLSFVLFQKTAYSQLDSFKYIRHYNITQIENIIRNFGADPSLLGVRYEIDVYKLYYKMPNHLGVLTPATGAIAVPQNITCAVPLASYQHGTVVKKTEVPSYSSTELQIGVALGSSGYLIVLPDYLGLGNSPGMHPYQHAKTQAQAVIDMLRSGRAFADSMNVRTNDQVFLFGYSQGGHATLAATKEIEQNHLQEFNLTASAPMSGAYDMSGAQTQLLLNGGNYPAPYYLPYVILGYQSVYGNIYNNIKDAFVPPFDSMLPIWYNGNYSAGYFDNFLPSNPLNMLQPAMINDFVSNPNNPFLLALKDNDLHTGWVPQTPVSILGCAGDDHVSFYSSLNAYNNFKNAGAPHVEIQDFGNLSHGDCVPYCLIFGKGFLDNYRKADNGMSILTNIGQASTPTSTDGSATVQVTGSTGNYAYTWSNGATSPTISGVGYGNYMVTVTDSYGCEVTQNVFIGNAIGLKPTPVEMEHLEVYPNPVTEAFVLKIPTEERSQSCIILMRDMTGRIVKTYTTNHLSAQMMGSRDDLPAGIYTIELRGKHIYQTKILLK